MPPRPKTPLPQTFLERERTQEMSPAWYQFMKDVPDWVEETLGIDEWSWYIEFPQAKTYKVVVNTTYARTINSITTDAEVGTATLTGKINTTALGGTANSVSTTEQTQTHTSANSMVAGDDFNLTLASVSGCEGVTVTVKWTRVF